MSVTMSDQIVTKNGISGVVIQTRQNEVRIYCTGNPDARRTNCTITIDSDDIVKVLG